jgi:hypothetical protein
MMIINTAICLINRFYCINLLSTGDESLINVEGCPNDMESSMKLSKGGTELVKTFIE